MKDFQKPISLLISNSFIFTFFVYFFNVLFAADMVQLLVKRDISNAFYLQKIATPQSYPNATPNFIKILSVNPK